MKEERERRTGAGVGKKGCDQSSEEAPLELTCTGKWRWSGEKRLVGRMCKKKLMKEERQRRAGIGDKGCDGSSEETPLGPTCTGKCRWSGEKRLAGRM